MPLPLPNLDTRQWADLVEEGRGLVPRYASRWTDHNVHDPGITLIELFAWMIEADIYRTNHISLRARRKFLRLIGFSPRPPQPARVVLSFTLTLGLAEQVLPAGMTFRTAVGEVVLPFRTLVDLRVVDSSIVAVQSTVDGKTFTDQTRAEQGRFGFSPWGLDPPTTPDVDSEKQPALYVGFSKELPANAQVTCRFRFAGPRTDEAEQQRLRQEMKDADSLCSSQRPVPDCTTPEPDDYWCLIDAPLPEPVKGKGTSPQSLRHHSARSAWDYFDGTTWQTLSEEQGQVVDETRDFTLDGAVSFKLPKAMKKPPAFGAIKDELGQPELFFYLRCRLVKGPLDYAPIIVDIQLNAVLAEQASFADTTFEIGPGVKPAPGQTPIVGSSGHLNIDFDDQDAIKKLAFTPNGEGPGARVIAYAAAIPGAAGSLTLTLELLGHGTGLPGQSLVLSNSPVAGGIARLWTILNGTAEEWSLRPDLDASVRTDAHFTLDTTYGEITFGDGERGRVVDADAAVLVSYDYCAASLGNLKANASWQLKPVDDPINQAVLGTIDIKDVQKNIATIQNDSEGVGGLDEEELDHAAGRAAELLWAHERLLELCPPGVLQTLDGLDPARVFERAAPQRATTLLDYERIALDIPGAPVARARAWSGMDAYLPCVKAPGTVVVTIVPWLPADRPEASPQLLAAVKQYLDRRRLVGTRLVTVGPKYLQVSVRATIATRTGVRTDRVVAEVVAALNRFLNPLRGGPAGRGWPFGRDVYRSEILEVIDQTSGVDHVEDLELVGEAGAPQCGNLCVGPLMLVTPGTHDIKSLLDRGTNGSANC